MSYVSNTGLAHYHEKMKTLLAGKASTSHTHNYAGSSSAGGAANSVANSLTIQTNGTAAATFNGSAAKTVNITYSNVGAAAASHSHNYAGSSSAGGNANAAIKLATARSISNNSNSLMTFSVSFDGSANVSGSLIPRCASISVGNTNNYPYHRIATYNTNGAWNDSMITIYLAGGYQGAPWGIVNITLRTNSTFKDNSAAVQWVVRNGYNVGDVIAAIYTTSDKTYIDVYVKTAGTYNSQIVQVLAGGRRGSLQQLYTLLNSTEVNDTTASDAKKSVESYVSIAAGATALYKASYTKTVSGVDAGTVKYASSTNTANKATQDSGGQQINTTYIKGISASGTTFTITKGNGTTSTLSAECMTNTEIDKLFA